VIGGASAWLNFQTESNGVVLVDTAGSSFDTVLSVYHATNVNHLSSALLAADNNGAPDGIRSLLRFDALAKTPYLAVVDGVNGSKGPARINWRLGLAPVIDPSATNPTDLTLPLGTNVTLHARIASAIPLPSYQWFLNGQILSGQTNSLLVLAPVQPMHAGTYLVVVSNFAGAVTNHVATIHVDVPLRLCNCSRTAEGFFRCQVMGNPGQGFALQASTNLTVANWVTLLSDEVPTAPLEFIDNSAPRYDRRFYRVMPWPGTAP
jgi:hypothetical protein